MLKAVNFKEGACVADAHKVSHIDKVDEVELLVGTVRTGCNLTESAHTFPSKDILAELETESLFKHVIARRVRTTEDSLPEFVQGTTLDEEDRLDSGALVDY